jgi:hypothetical protein
MLCCNKGFHGGQNFDFGLVGGYQHYGAMCCFHPQVSSGTLKVPSIL